MTKGLLIIFLLFGAVQSLHAQDNIFDKWAIERIEAKNPDIFYVDTYYDIPMPQEKLVKKIDVKKRWVDLRAKPLLVERGIDSTRHYGGNCFKMTYYDYSNTYIIGKEDQFQMTGEIYNLDSSEIAEIRSRKETYESPEEIEKKNYRAMRAAQDIVYDINVVLQYGGESKLALFFLPKINVLRKHKFKFANPYYGAEVGPHIALPGNPYGSISGIVGVEKSIFNLETSIGIFGVASSDYSGDGTTGPFSQTLFTFKGGIGTEDVRVKVGRSFVLNEYVPQGQERIPFLDVGKINNKLWSFELQFTMNN